MYVVSEDESVLHLDAEALKTLAHPLRSRLLGQLRSRGAATATQLADRLNTNTGATSYHLRKMEEVGLVQDTGDGAGKQRLWRAATHGHSWNPSEFLDDPDASAALDFLSRHYAHLHSERLAFWIEESSQWSPAWQDAAGLSDDGVKVNDAQLAQLRVEIDALIKSYRHKGDDDPNARNVNLFIAALPSPGQEPQ